MAKSDELRAKKERYKRCLKEIKNTADNLKEAIKNLESVLSVEKSCFKIDGSNGSGSYLYNLLEKEKTTYNKIKDEIIPSVERKIDDIRDDIKKAENDEKEG